MELYIYIDDVAHRVEMFQDEKVSVTSTIQNYSDIGKLFTDYSQSFTIPASPTNNSIFSHWYENAIDNGYDARIRYNAFIEIDTIPFRDGNVQLEKANKKNGYIESYTLTFYGNLTQLKDKFADDKLQVVFETTLGQALNHTYDASNIETRITSGSTFDVRYPLIANDRTFRYNDASPDDVTTNAGSIVWTDLFPAVKINKILELIEDNTKLDGNFQSEKRIIHRKEEIKQWFKFKSEKDCYDYSNENICVINFRGGEYANVPNFYLNQTYWRNAVNRMLSINPNFEFIVITDDVQRASGFFPNFKVLHFDIATDFTIIKNAHYLILSNSSFPYFATLCSETVKYILAPKYWGRHNISDGYWSCGYNIFENHNYIDRDDNLFSFEECIREFNEYKIKNNLWG